MAAVPKDILPAEHYERWTYPDINDISQAADYFLATYYLSDTTELYEVYGEKNYIIRTVDLRLMGLVVDGNKADFLYYDKRGQLPIMDNRLTN